MCFTWSSLYDVVQPLSLELQALWRLFIEGISCLHISSVHAVIFILSFCNICHSLDI